MEQVLTRNIWQVFVKVFEQAYQNFHLTFKINFIGRFFIYITIIFIIENLCLYTINLDSSFSPILPPLLLSTLVLFLTYKGWTFILDRYIPFQTSKSFHIHILLKEFWYKYYIMCWNITYSFGKIYHFLIFLCNN